MDAWETLIEGSTIPIGDAWEHLDGQGGGGSYLILSDGLEVEMVEACVSVFIDDPSLEVAIDNSNMEARLNENQFAIEIELVDCAIKEDSPIVDINMDNLVDNIGNYLTTTGV